MFDSVIQIILEVLLEAFWLVVLWPVVMVVCTPFVLIRAAVVVAAQRQRFFPAMADGYCSVSDFWGRFV